MANGSVYRILRPVEVTRLKRRGFTVNATTGVITGGNNAKLDRSVVGDTAKRVRLRRAGFWAG